jgi:hypothetical protein
MKKWLINTTAFSFPPYSSFTVLWSTSTCLLVMLVILEMAKAPQPQWTFFDWFVLLILFLWALSYCIVYGNTIANSVIKWVCYFEIFLFWVDFNISQTSIFRPDFYLFKGYLSFLNLISCSIIPNHYDIFLKRWGAVHFFKCIHVLSNTLKRFQVFNWKHYNTELHVSEVTAK